LADEPLPRRRPDRRTLIGPFSARQLALALGAVVLAAIVLVAVTTPLGSTNGPIQEDPRATAFVLGTPPPEGLKAGDTAPELTVTTEDGRVLPLTDVDGKPIQLSDLRGKAVWLNFWASWCPPCQGETPVLRDLADEYASKGLVIVGVDVQETADIAREYAQTYGLRYRVGVDLRADVFHRYKVFALPTQFFIDPNGRIVDRVVRPFLTRDQAIPEIEAILPKP
jgi:thiol-disulfide isomerase/thioredoxin